MIKNERGGLQVDPTKIIDVWKSYSDKLLNVHNGEQTEEFEIYTTEPWIPEPSEEFLLRNQKVSIHREGIDNIPVKLIKLLGTVLVSQQSTIIDKCSMEKGVSFQRNRKPSVIVPIYKNGDKSDCKNFSGIALLPTTYKLICNNLLTCLSVYVDEITGEHQYGFRRNGIDTVHQLFIDFKKSYNPISRGKLTLIQLVWESVSLTL